MRAVRDRETSGRVTPVQGRAGNLPAVLPHVVCKNPVILDDTTSPIRGLRFEEFVEEIPFAKFQYDNKPVKGYGRMVVDREQFDKFLTTVL